MALFLLGMLHVTLRITTCQDAGGTLLMVAGRLDIEGVAELEAVVAELSGPLRLDLAGLRSADEAGLEMLRALRSRGIALTEVSPYHRLLLGDTRSRKAPPPSSPSEGSRGDGAGRRGRPRRWSS